MKELYQVVGALETEAPALDDCALTRIEARARAALPQGRRRRWLPLALAAVLLLSACAAAAATGAFSRWFSYVAPQATAAGTSDDFLAGMGTVVGQSRTAGGVTATLDGVLYDGSTLVLELTFSGEDLPENILTQAHSKKSWLEPPDFRGKLLAQFPDMSEAEREKWLEASRTFGGFDGNRSNYSYDMESQTAQLLLYWNKDGVPNGGEVQMHLEQVALGGKETPLAGPFDFNFSLQKQLEPLHYTGPVSLEVGSGINLIITGVTVSAFNIQLDYTCSAPYPEDDAFSRQIGVDSLRIAGEETYPGSGNTVSVEETDTGFKGYLAMDDYRRAVDPATVEAVKVGGVWLTLSDFTLDQN